LTSDRTGKWIKLVWCQVEVHGSERLIGNGAARQQLRVLIGRSGVTLIFCLYSVLYDTGLNLFPQT
jgi:hypothetical protein